MVNYSVIIYAQEVIGSDLLSGIGFGLCFGPPLVLGWYAGVLCDRLAPGRLILAAQLVFIVAALLLWFADRSVAEPGSRVPWLVLAAALTGVGWSFVAPARMAALRPDRQRRRLEAGLGDLQPAGHVRLRARAR
ncbi:MAG: hypothetical protein IPG91_20380 [Ideonella sp.]|nr:hypothetical protein [Ideonella sp.]